MASMACITLSPLHQPTLQFLMVNWFGDRLKVVESERPCWFSWMILGVWPFMVVVGSLTQWRITGRGIYHQQCESHPLLCLLPPTPHTLLELL